MALRQCWSNLTLAYNKVNLYITGMDISLDSLKISVWYKGAAYLGIVLIAISAENSANSTRFLHLGAFSLILGAIFITIGWLIEGHTLMVEEHEAQYGGRGTEYNNSEVFRKVKPYVDLFKVLVVVGLFIWIAGLVYWAF